MIEKLTHLIDSKLGEINTVSLGVLTQIDLNRMRCNVKLKHRIQGNEIELFDVPIMFQKFSDSALIITPKEGDIVLILFSKYELEEQMKNREIVDVNELLKFNLNHACVIAGVFTAVDSIPSVNEGEVLIWHKSGSYMKFKQDGSLEIKAKRIDFNKLV